MESDSSYSSQSSAPQPKKQHRCTVEGCSAVFSKPNKLTYHLRKHAGEKPFVCDVDNCGKAYTNNAHLLRHKRSSHSNCNDSFNCTVEGCRQTFSTSHNLKRHVSRKHNPDREHRFECQICYDSFPKKTLLEAHLQGHTGVAAYSCLECKKNFTSGCKYRRHLATHRAHACACQQVFNKWSALLAHRKLCPDYRASLVKTCQECQKAFKNKSAYKLHLQTHLEAGDRTCYPCSVKDCTSIFMQERNLVEHVKRRHFQMVDRLQCPIDGCGKTYSFKSTLAKHLKAKHSPSTTSPVSNRRTPTKRRKDTGQAKTSSALKMAGLPEVPVQIQALIVKHSEGKEALEDPRSLLECAS